jgi:membrane associated rhomboid family serine protease
VSNNNYRPGGFGGFSFFPPVIKSLLIINGIVFLIQMLGQNLLIGDTTLEQYIIKYFALIPIGYGFLPWQLITYQFMHGGIMHIALNMFALWMFGIEIENIWGSKKFLFFYLMCGVAAGISQLIFPPLFNEPLAATIGASGAIFGVLIAFGMMFPDRYIYIYFLLPVKAKYLIIGYVLLELYSIPQGGNVAHLAHLGGALAGFIYLMYERKNNRLFGSYFKSSPKINFNMFKGSSNPFKKKEEKIKDAKYYEIKDDSEEVTQEQIDQILDKIGRSGYQNLSDKEKKILFEASKKMK